MINMSGKSKQECILDAFMQKKHLIKGGKSVWPLVNTMSSLAMSDTITSKSHSPRQ